MDAAGARRAVADTDVRAVQASMLADDGGERAGARSSCAWRRLPNGAVVIELEDGREIRAEAALAPDVPSATTDW